MATTYYVSPQGSDAQDGLSLSTAWQSLAKVNSSPLGPGDTVLLQGEQDFAGSLSFQPPRIGTADQPIVIGSYGSGKARILAGSNRGIYVYQGAGITIQELEIVGDGRALNDKAGILFYTDQSNPTRLAGIQLRQLDIHGFNRGGISLFSEPGSTELGYADILIEDCELHDNGDFGIGLQGKVRSQGYAHAGVIIRDCIAANNPGQIGKTQAHTGNGIVVGNADTVLIEYCEAHHNGAENLFQGGGPVGIWAWDSRQVLIQYNESHHNLTGSSKDGGGFDLDGGAVESVMQYNYSHDNEGAGFLLAEYNGARPLQFITIRYNISENDGRKNSYAGIMLWRGQGIFSDVDIYHNTIFVSPASNGSPRAFWSLSNGLDRVRVMNNLFISTGGLHLVDKSHSNGADISFWANGYHSSGATFHIQEGGGTYNTLSAWRNARAQETWNGLPTGIAADPQLLNPGGGGTIGSPYLLQSLFAYSLSNSSPVLNQGLNLVGELGISIGSSDFFGQALPPQGNLTLGAGAGTSSSLSLEPVVIAQPAENHDPSQQWQWKQSSDGGIRLSCQACSEVSLQLQVFDLVGRKALEQNHQLSPGLPGEISIKHLASGQYLIRLHNGTMVQWLRVMAY